MARTDTALDVTGRPTALRHVDLDTFFNPKRVAVVGASDTSARTNTALTRKITTWAEARGASVHYVNPNRSVVAGRPTVKSLADIDEQLDLVAILVGDPLPVLRDAVAAGAKFAVVFAAGFAEAGAKGERIQAEMERIIESGDTHLLGPNTNLNVFEVFRDDLPGRAMALITQSGHQGRPVFQGQEIGIKAVALGADGQRGGPRVRRLHRLLLEPPDHRRGGLLHRGVQERPHPPAGRRRGGPAQGAHRGREGGANRRGHFHGQGPHRPPDRIRRGRLRRLSPVRDPAGRRSRPAARCLGRPGAHQGAGTGRAAPSGPWSRWQGLRVLHLGRDGRAHGGHGRRRGTGAAAT